MELYISDMREKLARVIMGWKYSAPYDFYNNESSPEVLSELLSGSYFAVLDADKSMVGFYCVGKSAQVPNEAYAYSGHFIDIGLGLRPEYTGQGRGYPFLSFVLGHIGETIGNMPKRLTVAKFNQRAICLYEKFGFRQEASFVKRSTEFIVMTQDEHCKRGATMSEPAVRIREMSIQEADQLGEIDRSEWIEATYRMVNGQLERLEEGHECATWCEEQVKELIARFGVEVSSGGYAVGAYDEGQLVGFGVLGHKFRGSNSDQLHVDLLYVTRNYRRRGIGKRIMDELEKAAKARGASCLYISSTETQSAVSFYRSYGGELAAQVDPELFALEPYDIHMLKKL